METSAQQALETLSNFFDSFEPAKMARLSSANPPPAAVTDNTTTINSVNLTRMIARLQAFLINPEADKDYRLRTSEAERQRVGRTLESAQKLLVRLEHDSQTIKVQTTKQEKQADLLRKRELLRRFAERLQEYHEFAEHEPSDDSSEGEDLLGEDTPSEDTNSRASHGDPTSLTPSPTGPSPPSPLSQITFSTQPQPQPQPQPQSPPQSPPQPQQPPQPEPSTLRNRNARSELFSTQAEDTGISTATTEALLTHNRLEQEALTSSLLNMAVQLKQSSRAFGASLESEKDILNNAAGGLDKNELAIEAAQRKMGMLRTMTEGRGWVGRMIMYACIFGLWVLAILVVFVMPKLRF